jgi:hypothetical protein
MRQTSDKKDIRNPNTLTSDIIEIKRAMDNQHIHQINNERYKDERYIKNQKIENERY